MATMHPLPDNDYALADRYDRTSGRIHATGTQALVRVGQLGQAVQDREVVVIELRRPDAAIAVHPKAVINDKRAAMAAELPQCAFGNPQQCATSIRCRADFHIRPKMEADRERRRLPLATDLGWNEHIIPPNFAPIGRHRHAAPMHETIAPGIAIMARFNPAADFSLLPVQLNLFDAFAKRPISTNRC